MGMANSGHESGADFHFFHSGLVGRPTNTMHKVQPQHHSCDPGGSTWLERLAELLARHPEHGSGPDVESMTMFERSGLYLGLRRIDESLGAAA
jgi:hypothetical protein